MIKIKSIFCALALLCVSAISVAQDVPAVQGKPIIDGPKLLNFPYDTSVATPDLNEATANRVFDVHANMQNCDSFDLILSTAGNYHMALRELWFDTLLKNNPSALQSWMYTTSPPISRAQIKSKALTIGNISFKCAPHVVVAPKPEIDALIAEGVTMGEPVKVFKNRGNVLLVKKGNPKNIQSMIALGRNDVRLVTPSPSTEPSTFKNYSSTIYNVVFYQQGKEKADEIFASIFNNETKRWFAGAKIHHREVPWSVAYGNADVGVVFYHLGKYLVEQFPDTFDIVPLGGTVQDPQPVKGNNVGMHFAVRVKDDTINSRQTQARELFMASLSSEEFTTILVKHGMQR